MRILARPAFKDRHKNPYTWLLYSHIKDLGTDVEQDSPLRLLQNNYAIWHLHWPENGLNKENKVNAFARTQALLLQIDWARRRNVKIVWTVHNLGAHEQLHPKLEAWFWNAFIQRLDGYIALSKVAMETAQERFFGLKNLPGFVIPHGHYRGEYPDHMTSQEARASLGIPPLSKVLLFCGQIRPYKNLLQLIHAFRQLPDLEGVLYIAGRPHPPAFIELLETEAALDPRVQLHPSFIPKDKVQVYLRAADLVILPYREILNSGSALLALSFDRPILVPRKGSLSELQAQVGEEWVRTYDGEITPLQIEEALEWALSTSRSKQAPLEAFGWKELSQRTIDVYKTVMTKSGRQ